MALKIEENQRGRGEHNIRVEATQTSKEEADFKVEVHHQGHQMKIVNKRLKEIQITKVT